MAGKRMLRTALATLVALQCTITSGCSLGYTEASLPTDAEAEGVTELPEVHRGTEARVHLHSGEVIEGEVLEVSPTVISIGKPSNFGYQERLCLKSDIERIEIIKSSRAADAIARAVTVVGVVATILAIAIGIACSGGGCVVATT